MCNCLLKVIMVSTVPTLCSVCEESQIQINWNRTVIESAILTGWPYSVYSEDTDKIIALVYGLSAYATTACAWH